MRRIVGILLQLTVHDQLGDIDMQTQRLAAASVESIAYLGNELRALDERLSKIESDIASLRELLAAPKHRPPIRSKVRRSHRPRPAEMSIPPGSVWLDARGAQSAQHGEAGFARYVAEHVRAFVKLAPEAIGSIGLDSRAPPPPSIKSLVGTGMFAWHRRTRSLTGQSPSIYHVMLALRGVPGVRRHLAGLDPRRRLAAGRHAP